MLNGAYYFSDLHDRYVNSFSPCELNRTWHLFPIDRRWLAEPFLSQPFADVFFNKQDIFLCKRPQYSTELLKPC
jgi:hypothetical protein